MMFDQRDTLNSSWTSGCLALELLSKAQQLPCWYKSLPRLETCGSPDCQWFCQDRSTFCGTFACFGGLRRLPEVELLVPKARKNPLESCRFLDSCNKSCSGFRIPFGFLRLQDSFDCWDSGDYQHFPAILTLPMGYWITGKRGGPGNLTDKQIIMTRKYQNDRQVG